ncbi:MAG: hypothetical protein VKJ05_02835 [Synechococcaceae cyanobacterium]|nr:hypothetical protein [Synechococcaceae cyanobacterium]
MGTIGTAMRRARFNHLVHHKLASTHSWTRQRLLSSEQLSQNTRQQLQETAFGESINPTLDALLLFAGVPFLATIPLHLRLAPAALPVGLLIALAPFAMTSWVHPHLHAKADGLLGHALQPLRDYHAEHHRRPWTHFNLVPGGDVLLGTHELRRRPPEATGQ